MYRIKIFAFFAFIFMLVIPSQASSIWAKRSKDMKDLYADDVARKIGDILTIQIDENSTVDNSAQRDLQKDTDRSTTFNGELGGFADIGEYGMSASSANGLSSTADYKDERNYIDNITVVVIDILPNKNLVVKGTRQRNVAGEIQEIEVSGIVRPSDIDYDNTVQSERIADFYLLTKNTGHSERYSNPGWLGAILDFIWPF